MGYTHYWTQKATFTKAEWRELVDGVKKLSDLANLELVFEQHERTPPQIDDEVVRFNGFEEDGYETFLITRKRPEAVPYRKLRGWDFCKTDERAYDVAVTAVLAYLDAILPDKWETTSDGRTKDWNEGVALARKAWPNKANQIGTPRAVIDTDRYDRYLHSDEAYFVAIGWDGNLYIEKVKIKTALPLPYDLDAFNAYVSKVPHNRRLYGSFGPGEMSKCRRRFMKTLWAETTLDNG